MDWRDVGIRVSYQIKTKRERNRRGVARKKKKTLTLFYYTRNYDSIFFLS
jgi:hypothetical protein